MTHISLRRPEMIEYLLALDEPHNHLTPRVSSLSLESLNHLKVKIAPNLQNQHLVFPAARSRCSSPV